MGQYDSRPKTYREREPEPIPELARERPQLRSAGAGPCGDCNGRPYQRRYRVGKAVVCATHADRRRRDGER